MPTRIKSIFQTHQFERECQALDRCTYEDAQRFIERTKGGNLEGFVRHVIDTNDVIEVAGDTLRVFAAHNGQAHIFVGVNVERAQDLTFLSVHADEVEVPVEGKVDVSVLKDFNPAPETNSDQEAEQ